MALTDIFTNAFTGDPIKAAAAKQRQYLDTQNALTTQNISGNTGQGLGALTAGATGATNAITGGVNAATGYVEGAQPNALAALQSGQYAGANALTSAVDPALAAITGGATAAGAAYNPVSDISNQYSGYTSSTSQAEADALGLNGPEGIARSRAAFTTSPGYQFSTEQGLQGVVRGANAAGMAPGGNTLAAAGEYVTNAANKEWDNYMAALRARQGLYAPLALSGAGTAAGGRANAALAGGTGAANIYMNTGSRLADLYSQGGRDISGVYTGTGKTLGDIAMTGGTATANADLQAAIQQANLLGQMTQLQTGYTTAQNPLYGSTYGAEGTADMYGSTNLWNLGLNAAKAAAGSPTTLAGLLPASGPSVGPYPRIGG